MRIWAGQAPDDIVAEHTQEFADAYATNQVGQLPGLKSPPPVEGIDDLVVGAEVGAIAPDMLMSPKLEPEGRWLLSSERGRTITVAIVPPGCMRCGRAVGAEEDTTQGAVILLGDDQGTERLELEWSPEIGRLYAPQGDLQLIQIDERGVILSISGMLE